MENMYEGYPFSPETTLTTSIGASETVIPVSDVSVFPEAPNYATIGGNDGSGETILYSAKTGSSLSGCTRGIEGTAKSWDSGEIISRNWTAKDHNSLIKNLKELLELLNTHAGNKNNPHDVTAEQVGADPTGSSKAVDNKLTNHVESKTNPHGVTAVQVGADPAGSAEAVDNKLTSHVESRSNPHNVTAEQAGARPSTWTPSASEVGADPAGTAQNLINNRLNRTTAVDAADTQYTTYMARGEALTNSSSAIPDKNGTILWLYE